MSNNARSNLLWTTLSDVLDIPKSLYERAANRHQSLAEWLCRPESQLAQFAPVVRPQGSFRYGTVIRPIDPAAEYDLDNVVVLERLTPSALSQQQLKTMLGVEVAGYAEAHRMQQPSEHNRCWRLHYRDEESFHLDSLPCVPAGDELWSALRETGIEPSLARRAVAITDRRLPNYTRSDSSWLTSNPRGFARWFESRAGLGRDPSFATLIRGGKIETVPPYEWRTPLQRSIQILKRHRDVMYRHSPDIAPISMILTNLAASAYQGEQDLTDALTRIVERMPNHVRADHPRVPNPTHPREDYADKWRFDSRLEASFWEWHAQVQADVRRLSSPLALLDQSTIAKPFDLTLPEAIQRELAARAPWIAAGLSVGETNSTRRVEHIEAAPKPWGRTQI